MKGKKYWALFDKAGELHRVIESDIGEHFFGNAARGEMRVARVIVVEVAMTKAEQALVDACPECGQTRKRAALRR